MSLFRHMPLRYWQPAIVCLCILCAIAVDYVAKRLCLMGTGLLRTRGLPEGIFSLDRKARSRCASSIASVASRGAEHVASGIPPPTR